MKPFVALFILLFSVSCYAQNDAYQNPVDGKTYVAPGGWNTYKPQRRAKPIVGRVSLAGIRLLQSQAEIGARASPEDLSDFITRAHQAASEVFASYDKPATLLVQFTCRPNTCSAQIASQGDPPRDLLQAFYDRLTRLQPLKASGEVKFQFTLKVQP